MSVARFDTSTIHSLLDDKSHLDSTRELYKAYTYGGTYEEEEERGEEEEEGEEEEGAGDNFHPMYKCLVAHVGRDVATCSNNHFT